MPWSFYNSNGQRLSTAATSINVLDIDGATDIGADIVDADLFIIDDGAGGTNRKTQASRIKTYVTPTTVATGEYTGDDTTSKNITSGLGSVQVKFVMVAIKVSSGEDLDNREFIMTSDTMVNDNAAGISINLWNSATPEFGSNGIIALNSDGTFTVDDAGGNAHPNKSSQLYNFVAWA